MVKAVPDNMDRVRSDEESSWDSDEGKNASDDKLIRKSCLLARHLRGQQQQVSLYFFVFKKGNF